MSALVVTDAKVLSKKERNRVLWYACDSPGGDLGLVKSVIRAGCDVDQFHKGHTPLMMASIRGRDDVVKELILAGCKVDLRSSNRFVSWFSFITMVALTWPFLVVWAVATLFRILELDVWVQPVCYLLIVLTTAYYFISEDSFKVSEMLRMKSWTQYITWAGTVPAVVLTWDVVGTAAEEQTLTVILLLAVTGTVTVTMIMAVTGMGVPGEVPGARPRTVVSVVAVIVAGTGMRMWSGSGAWAVVAAGAVAAAAVTLAAADTVAATAAITVAAAVAAVVIWTDILPAVLGWEVIRTVAEALSMPVTLLVALSVTVSVKVTMLILITGAGVVTQIKELGAKARARASTVATVAAVVVIGIRMWSAGELEVWSVKMASAAVPAVAVVAVVVKMATHSQTDSAEALTTVIVAAIVSAVVASSAIWAMETPIYRELGTAGKVVAVTALPELALSMTMEGAGAVPFAVLMIVIVIVAVSMAAVGLVGFNYAYLGSVAGPMILKLAEIVLLALTPIGVIRRMSTLSVTGMTALHYAAWYNHITCGTHLVEAGANVQAENKYFRTPLHICSHRFRAAVKQAQSSPPKQVIAVIGYTEYGKSTLIAALQSESRTLFQRFVFKLAQVYNITQRTTGIETVPFSSAKYGEILFYDFAGQSDYHGPHQPFLEAMLSKPGVSVTVLLLVKVTEVQDVIRQQLIRWLQPVALASTLSTPKVIVVGSFLDQVKSKKEAHQKLQGCIDSVQKWYPFLEVREFFLLDCRQPESAGIKGLRSYLQRTHPIRSTSGALLYNVHWVMAQLQKTFSEQSLQLNTFRAWLQDNAQSIPTGLPRPEDVCKDLSAAGCILFLRNKQDLSQSWLVLDLQTILHNVYGTLFSPSQDVVNQFGLLPCSHLSKLFPKLDPKMIQEVLITLEFCIRVDPLLLKEEMLSVTEQEEVEGWLYFPALVSAKAHEVFTPGLDPDCLHWACWQLKTDNNHIILAHLLQGILLHLAATHVFIEKELPCSVRKHCCRVWVNGLSWGSTTGVDVAVHISDSSTIQVIGRSIEGPGELYRYMSGVTQSIFKTIAKLSPALKATPYIIHPYTYIGLDESTSSPPTTRYPVASVIGSIEAGDKYVFSLSISSGSGSVNYNRASLQELFGGWPPSLTVVQRLKEAQEDTQEDTRPPVRFAILTANPREQNVVRHFLNLGAGIVCDIAQQCTWDKDTLLCDLVSVESLPKTPDYDLFKLTDKRNSKKVVAGVHMKLPQMGGTMVGAATDTTLQLLDEAEKRGWSLEVIFAVGFCGVSLEDPTKGDSLCGTVLLSSKLEDYLAKGEARDSGFELHPQFYQLKSKWPSYLSEIAITQPLLSSGEFLNIPVEEVHKIGSGPLVIKDTEFGSKIRAGISIVGLEMESSGIARALSYASRRSNVPELAVVKAISHCGGKDENQPGKTSFFGTDHEDVSDGTHQEVATFHAIALVMRCVAVKLLNCDISSS